MLKRYLIYVFVVICLIVSTEDSFSQNRPNELQTTTQLALKYYNAKDFEKAAPLLLEVYTQTGNSSYFRLYLNSLIELQNFKEAENTIQKEIKKQRTANPEYLIHLGYVLKAQKKPEEAEKKYEEALSVTTPARANILSSANMFLQWQEYDWARKVYLKGRKEIPEEEFNYELARAYLYLRNYGQMMEEYLNLVKLDEAQLPRVESALSSALRLDVDEGLKNDFRQQVIKRIQDEPNVTGYSRLLIWFFLQDGHYAGALRQSIALDRRTESEDTRIFQLGQVALNNKMYGEAERAFSYLTEKGESSPFYVTAYVNNIHSAYLRYTTGSDKTKDEGEKLSEQFEEGLEKLGYSAGTLGMINDYAHLLAFYLNSSEKAIEILEKGLEIPRLKVQESGRLKTEMADIYIHENDPWEATLLYSQVIEANKNNTLGDDVKLKKAILGYFMGNFSWAKAQLDVLKASTSKLTANDAMDLSLLIGNNLNLDTTAVPLQMFARADLLFFRNRQEEALATLDSIMDIYPYHSLVDNILFRKAKIETERNNYETAASYLQEITENFAYGLLGDDALFMLAELNNYHLNDREKAKELYRLMLTRYPGSVFTEESREKFRELREIYPDAPITPLEELIIPDTIPDELF